MRSARAFQSYLLILSLLVAASLGCACAQDDLGDAVFEEANSVFEHADRVRYEHHHVPASEQVRIDGDGCVVHSDCSGFVSYVLKKVAPKHYAAVRDSEPRTPYPQAKAYEAFFSSLSKDSPDAGWIRLGKFSELRRGDIIAWRKPHKPGHKGGNTGHVMIVADKPGMPGEMQVNGETVRFVEVPVIDCSSVDHFKPEELPPHASQSHRDGLGKGQIRLILDGDDRVIGYWEGTYWGEGQKNIEVPTYTRLVEFARLVSNR